MEVNILKNVSDKVCACKRKLCFRNQIMYHFEMVIMCTLKLFKLCAKVLEISSKDLKKLHINSAKLVRYSKLDSKQEESSCNSVKASNQYKCIIRNKSSNHTYINFGNYHSGKISCGLKNIEIIFFYCFNFP